MFIQLLACNPKPGCLPTGLQHILSSAEYVNQTHVPDFLFYNAVDHGRLTRRAAVLLSFLCFVPGANQKKPSAPDMFTESDDMFAADFDVSELSCAATVAILQMVEVGNVSAIFSMSLMIMWLCRVPE